MSKTPKIQKFFLKIRWWWQWHPHAQRNLKIAVLITSFLLGIMFISSFYYRFQRRNESITYGLSFSTKYAQELGLDWQAAYTALLDDAGFRQLRLMSYWDLHETSKDVYDFTSLDWQMDEAAKRDAKVMLAIGWRQPRWPECHTPSWIKNAEQEELNNELFEYITIVVQRYSDHPALDTYQLENEYFNRNFGECPDHSHDRLQQEYELVKTIDPMTPVVISFADQLGFPLRGPKPERYATSLYRANYVPLIGYFPYPIPSAYYSAKAQFVRAMHDREVDIHELQLEPWGPLQTVQLTDEEQYRYMSPRKIERNLHFARLTGMKSIYLWGGEWWYWRKVAKGDTSQWDTVKKEINKHESLPFWQLF